jgi:glutathione S-transferase
MTEVFVLGFPRSTYVHIVRLMLTHKGVSYTFRDLEPEMGSASHLALHPFDRVPILQHGDFTLYETSAIATYVDEAFEGPALQPKDVRARARMNQWISSVNSYYYPYMIYHVTHERLVYRSWESPATRKWLLTHCQRSSARSTSWRRRLATGPITSSAAISRSQISSCCRARMLSG